MSSITPFVPDQSARTAALVLALAGLLGACAATGGYKAGAPYRAGGLRYAPREQAGYDQTGLASWYGAAFDGRRTANGEVFHMRAVSAAHATLPIPSFVEVTNLDNGRALVVRINDRAPCHRGRIIDLSRAAAEALGFAARGTARVRVRYLGSAPPHGLDPQAATGF